MVTPLSAVFACAGIAVGVMADGYFTDAIAAVGACASDCDADPVGRIEDPLFAMGRR